MQEKCGWQAGAALQVFLFKSSWELFVSSFLELFHSNTTSPHRTGTKLHALLQKLQVIKEEYRWANM